MSLFGPTRESNPYPSLPWRTDRSKTPACRSILSARVNAARLAQYKSQTVRLTGKVVRMDGDTAIIEASDGGQVIRLIRVPAIFSLY
jgi:hypothetical protein